MRLFYSYSSKDEAFRVQLEAHLSLLKREGFLETWSFRDIDAGDDWVTRINDQLARADVVLLLISANFLASSYCMDVEMRRSVQRADAGETILIPIVIKPCDWKSAPFARFQVLPEGAKPISLWRPRDLAWASVTSDIRAAIARHANKNRDAFHATLSYVQEAAARLQNAAEIRERDTKEVPDALKIEFRCLTEELQSVAQEIGSAAPALGLRFDSSESRVSVRTVNASVEMECGTFAITVTGNFREDRFTFFTARFKSKWRPYLYKSWYFHLCADGVSWEWRDFDKGTVPRERFAAQLMNDLLATHAAVFESKPIKAISLPTSSNPYRK
jgi:hypothetical protein